MKYPKTFHIRGSKGVVEDEQVSVGDLPGDRFVIEEKCDGSEAAIAFHDGGLELTHKVPRGESRSMFKAWVSSHRMELKEILGSRYVMFGEWLYAKHTIFYDALPDYFLEFDIYDKEEDVWLSTRRRHEMLRDTGILSVPVLATTQKGDDWFPLDFIEESLFRSENNLVLLKDVCGRWYDFDKAQQETVMSRSPEGLFIKAETSTQTVGWYKWILREFLQTILDSGSHWRERPVIPNQRVTSS